MEGSRYSILKRLFRMGRSARQRARLKLKKGTQIEGGL